MKEVIIKAFTPTEFRTEVQRVETQAELEQRQATQQALGFVVPPQKPFPDPPPKRQLSPSAQTLSETTLAPDLEAEPPISEITHIIAALLFEAKCPARHHAFIYAVLALAKNITGYFDASDIELGQLLRPDDTEAEVISNAKEHKKWRGRLKKNVQRERDAL